MAHSFGNIVEHIHGHAGDTLQAVIIYEEDHHRDLYRRDDIADLHDSALEREVLDVIRDDDRRRFTETSTSIEGAHRATVDVFENRVLLHLPRDESSGTLVVLDTTAARNLYEFVEDLRASIYGS